MSKSSKPAKFSCYLLLASHQKDTNLRSFHLFKVLQKGLWSFIVSYCIQEHLAVWFWRWLLHWEQYRLFLVCWGKYFLVSPDGLEHVTEVKLQKCIYIQDQCLQRLSETKNMQKSLLQLWIISCGNVTDKGIIALHKLTYVSCWAPLAPQLFPPCVFGIVLLGRAEVWVFIGCCREVWGCGVVWRLNWMTAGRDGTATTGDVPSSMGEDSMVDSPEETYELTHTYQSAF